MIIFNRISVTEQQNTALQSSKQAAAELCKTSCARNDVKHAKTPHTAFDAQRYEQLLTQLAGGSGPAVRAAASPADVVTPGSVLTLTGLTALLPQITLWASYPHKAHRHHDSRLFSDNSRQKPYGILTHHVFGT